MKKGRYALEGPKMKLIDINSITPPGAEVAIFQGINHGTNVSFFIVHFSPGKGPKKHRHPYEETFIILDGEIEALSTARRRSFVRITLSSFLQGRGMSSKTGPTARCL